jgi:hypothetical protein
MARHGDGQFRELRRRTARRIAPRAAGIGHPGFPGRMRQLPSTKLIERDASDAMAPSADGQPHRTTSSVSGAGPMPAPGPGRVRPPSGARSVAAASAAGGIAAAGQSLPLGSTARSTVARLVVGGGGTASLVTALLDRGRSGTSDRRAAGARGPHHARSSGSG